MGARKKPWDKRKGESDRAYDAFSMYLEMKDRNYQKLGDLLSKTRQQIGEWARKYDWKERAAAYDSSVVEALRKDKIRRIKKIAAKMDTVGNLMVDSAIEYLEKYGVARCSCRSATEMADIGSRLVIQAIELESGEENAADQTLTINIVNAGEGDDK